MAENDEQDLETYDEEAPRSIFSALWFRALVVVLVLGVVAAVAVPYALDVMTTPTAKSTVAMRPAAAPPPGAPPQPAPPMQASGPVATPAPTPAAEPPRSAPATPEAAKPEVAKPDAAKPEPPKPDVRPPEPARPVPAKPESPKVAASKPASPPKVAEPPTPTDVPKAAEPAKPVEVAKPIESPKPAESAKPAESTPPAEATKPVAPRVASAPPAPPETLAPKRAAGAPSSAPYWVQVGAFKDEATARKVADKLRELNFSVEQSMRTRAASSAAPGAGAPVGATMSADRYNLFVSGLAPSELSTKLTAKGLSAQPVAGGVMVTPSMPLREAVALSKDLAAEGLKVQVRRVASSGGIPDSTSPSASPAVGSEIVHRVRVGAFAERAAAVAAARELEAKGYKVYIARGNQ